MASNYLDEFVLNFDLNQLTTEEKNYKVLEQRYEKLRKATSWLKSKIISTDFAIQKYQTKKDDYEQAVKAHTVTREELKQVCINYKDASDKCTILQNENKMLLANHQVFQEKLTDIENKYAALISHSNQLQLLVKQLENEKDALTVEKELDKYNNKDTTDEIRVLKKEKEAMLNDFKSLKDVILGKKKTSKKHMKIIKKYAKDIKPKELKILSTPEESDDDINYEDVPLQRQNKFNEVHNFSDKKLTSNTGKKIIDNCSDGEVSVDTGRGSSRANSHDKYLSSPDYVVNLETLSQDVIKQIDVANSPITVYPCRSIGTSPIIFDNPAPLSEHQYNNCSDCFDGAEYIIEDIPLSEEIDVLVEEEKLADCPSPVPDLNKLIEIDPNIENCKYIIVKESAISSSGKSWSIDRTNFGENNEFDQDAIIEKQTSGRLAENTDTLMINVKKTFVDACTSPLLILPDLRKFANVGTSTLEYGRTMNHENNTEFEIHNSGNKSLINDNVIVSKEKEYCNASTSPIAKLRVCCKCNDVDSNTVSKMGYENQMSRSSDKCTNSITLTEKKRVDASTCTELIQFKEYNTGVVDVLSKKQNSESRKCLFSDVDELPVNNEEVSKCSNKKRHSQVKDNITTNPIEKIWTQEKVCLESNSSKNLHFECSNDTEVQNILNVMKLHHDLISPISKTPADTDYLKLIPEMNCTLAKIWSAITNIYKVPSKKRNNDSSPLCPTEIGDREEIPEIIINNSKRKSNQQLEIIKELKKGVKDDKIHASNSAFVTTSNISTDKISSELPNMSINESSNVIKSKTIKPDQFGNELLRYPITVKEIIIAENNETYPQQSLTNSSDLNKICESNTYNSNKTVENIRSREDENYDDKEKRDSLQQRIPNDLKLNEVSENSNNIFDYSNNTETYNVTASPTAHTIIINGTKMKKKSKLDKFRDKLLPTSKIKKMTPISKHSSKAYIKVKNNAASSLSLNQKIAYENAVKVMAEIRSNEDFQGKKKLLKPVTEVVNLESDSNKIKSSSETPGLKTFSTRSRTGRLSMKEDTTVIANPDQKIRDIEKSPVNRKRRKRFANTEEDNLQSPSKRILRSSNVTKVRNDYVVQQLYEDFDKNSQCKANVKTLSCSDNTSNENVNDDHSNKFNLKNNCCSTETKSTGPSKSDTIFKKSIIRKTQPVIELSKCLADNANVVSITPGNVGYLDINKNINHTNKSTSFNKDDGNNRLNSNLETNNDVIRMKNLVASPNSNDCIKNCLVVTNTRQEEKSIILMGNKHGDDTSVNERSKDDQNINRIVNNSEQISEQHNPSIHIEHSLHIQDNGITNRKQNLNASLEYKLREEANIGLKYPMVELIPLKNDGITTKNNIVNYSDLDVYTEGSTIVDDILKAPPRDSKSRKDNILCAALDRYGVISVKYAAKKVPEAITLKILQKIEDSIPKIIASSKSEQKSKMDDLVASIQNFKTKHILIGLMKYLKDPTRKNELFNKVINGPAPPMTKSEVILLYVVESLNRSLPPGFINKLWNNIEHALFQLNRAPEFDVIESMSHFYAVLCRYFRNKSRLRCFMLDAMYCLQFKAIPLIRQCLDVCPGVLPNAHERLAKTSLVTCLVYLLHFYKCQDKFNRAQDIRTILHRKYQYRFSEWNETMILEIFRKAIMDLRGTHNDKKMLRVALIILCKRHGAKWCQLNIIKNMLLPIIEKKDVPERIKQFCVLMLGPLLKPFPADRKAQCEMVINQLLQMLKQKTSLEMEEAIFSSLIFMNKHDQERVVQALLSWNPENVSQDFEEILNDYVMEKPLAVWKKLVTRKSSQYT